MCYNFVRVIRNMNKKELRKFVKSADLPKEYISTASKTIQNKVLCSEAFKQSCSVFIYVSTEREPATDMIIEAALLSGKRVCVPKCKADRTMIAVEISDLSQLEAGCFGIREPVSDKEEESNFDLCIIPCAAASSDGRRLGHGGGYYDKFLENFSTYKMCLCFGRNIIEDIPVSEYDIKMDEVVTEQ